MASLDDVARDSERMVAGIEVDFLRATLELFSYDGFDPLVIFEELIKLESDEDKRDQEVKELLLLLMSRGSKISKIKKKTGKEGQKRMESLALKYKIKESTKFREIERTDLTLARLGAVFPNVCGAIANAVALEPKLPGYDLKMARPAFFLPQMASIIPSWSKHLLFAYQFVCLEFNHLIKGKKKSLTSNDLEEALKYMRIQNESKVGTNSQRTDWCKSLGIIERQKGSTGDDKWKILVDIPSIVANSTYELDDVLNLSNSYPMPEGLGLG